MTYNKTIGCKTDMLKLFQTKKQRRFSLLFENRGDVNFNIIKSWKGTPHILPFKRWYCSIWTPINASSFQPIPLPLTNKFRKIQNDHPKCTSFARWFYGRYLWNPIPFTLFFIYLFITFLKQKKLQKLKRHWLVEWRTNPINPRTNNKASIWFCDYI